MSEKIALVIGGNSGVGKKTAIDLAKKEVKIIIVGSNKSKTEIARQEIIRESQNKNVISLSFDLSTKSGVEKLYQAVAQKVSQVDILISSVGVMFSDLKLSADGYDLNLVLNYLTHFWIIQKFLPLLTKSTQGRILLIGAVPLFINYGKVSLPDFKVDKKAKYKMMSVVSSATAARYLLMLYWNQKLEKTNVTINIFHPGYVTDSSLGNTDSWISKQLGKVVGLMFSKKDQPIGAYLSLDSKLANTSGKFFNEKKKIVKLSKSYSMSMAEELYQMTKDK